MSRPWVATAVFVVVCTGGSAAALVLAVQEARRSDPVIAQVAGRERDRAVTVVRVDLFNTTSGERCVALRVVARDRDGRDLADDRPAPLRLSAGARRTAEARLTLTETDYAERLATIVPVVGSC